METRAAVAHEAGKPLTIEMVQLDGPKAGEVLVEVKATGICHTDAFTLSGGDPEGLFPAILGHEGAGIVVDVGPGVTSLKKGDHVIPLYTPGMPAMRSCLSRKTNLCTAIRATQGQGVMPDGTSRFSLGGQKIHHYMGTSTFANFTVLPEIAVAKIREDAPFDKVCYIGCGVTTGIGAVINTAKVEAGAKVVVFGLGGIGLNVVQGARMVGAEMIVGVDLNPGRRDARREIRHDAFRQPEGGRGRPRAVSGRPDQGRRRLQLRVHRQCRDDAPGAGMLPSRLGGQRHHRRRRRGQEISTRPFQLVTGRIWKGTAFGGARGRTDVPRIVDWYMDGKINIDDLITHTMPLDDINEGFELMHKASRSGAWWFIDRVIARSGQRRRNLVPGARPTRDCFATLAMTGASAAV
jgi:S-(hydroxymethyl)glutathione dehydrogenase/alcohol dehydrogenase